MKTFLLLALSISVFPVLSYTNTDVSNASFLATEGIIVKQSSALGYRLDATITRAEAIGTALKLKGVALPSNYFCKNYFTDVKYDVRNNWICRAIEIAADEGIISRANTKARPQDRITRAEALAILVNIIVNPEEGIPSPSPGPLQANFVTDVDGSSVWWDMIYYASATGIIQNPNFDNFSLVLKEQEAPFYFYPDRPATRSDFFGFAINTENKFKYLSCDRQELIKLSDEYFKRGSCLYFKTSWAYQDTEMLYVENADSDSFVIIDYLFTRDKDTVFKINQGSYISIEVGDNFSTEINKDGNLIVIRNGQKYLADFSTKELKKI